MRQLILIILFGFLTIYSNRILAQQGNITISGFIKDKNTGEALISSNILLYKDTLDFKQQFYRGTASNSYGFYSIPNLPKAKYYLVARNIGYKTSVNEIEITIESGTVRLNVNLIKEDVELGEVVVSDKKIEGTNISTISVSPDMLKQLPSLSGEVDLFKSLQLLPGVSVASELSNGLYVRGGSPDQTLTLVDNMMIYNPAHLGNFASTFNSDALQDIKLIKGAFPAEYGGRLSSVLDLKLKSGTKETNKGSIGLGMINSNLTLEGPLSDKATYMLSGRAMYYDLIQKNIVKSKNVPLYNFYDINSKFTYNISDNDIISISGFLSRDHLYNPENSQSIFYDVKWQNGAINLNWLHISSSSLFSNTTISFINYEFQSIYENDSASVTAGDYFSSSRLHDFILNRNMEYTINSIHSLKAGLGITLHQYDLLASNFYDIALEGNSRQRTNIFSTEGDLYLQFESNFSSKLKTNIGGRLNYFIDGKYLALEPRLSFNYAFTENFKIKGAFSIAHQFLNLIVRNDISLPTDLWYPSTEKIKPSKSFQYVFGFESYFMKKEILFSVEGYYRNMKNLYEFNDKADFSLNNSIEDLLVSGSGEAYGVELFLNKRAGKLTGWIGYTLSWSKRQFDELNGGRVFYPRYDRRNDVSVVMVYNFTENFSGSLTWVYGSGQGITFPEGQYSLGNIGIDNSTNTRLNYTGRNNYKLPAYHKMDINFNYKFIFDNKLVETYVSLLNVYNRQNPFAQYVTTEESSDGQGTKETKIKRITLFPFIPSIGLKINF